MSAPKPLTRDSLKIYIPQPSSSAESGLSSSLSPSSTSILSSIQKSHSASSLSNNGSPGTRITFAPLPSTEPRKRRSASQPKLGVGSRSSMVRQRQLASVNLNNADQERSKERTRSQNPKAQKKCQPPSSEVWQENEKAHSKARTRSERPGDLEDPFIVMGRLMRNAWRRVSSPQMSPGGISALGGNDGGPDCDAPKEIISEEEPEMERRPQYNHIKSESTHMIEGGGLGVFGDAPISNASTVKLKIPNPNPRSAGAEWDECDFHS